MMQILSENKNTKKRSSKRNFGMDALVGSTCDISMVNLPVRIASQINFLISTANWNIHKYNVHSEIELELLQLNNYKTLT